jgi:hypothetical protein
VLLQAAINDMWVTRHCYSCKHKPKGFNGISFAGCPDCDDEDKWEWRELCKQNDPKYFQKGKWIEE